MQILYAHEFRGENLLSIIDDVMDSFSEPTHSFVRNLVIITIQHQDELDVLIRYHAKNWDVDRIAMLDRILLRLGVCEFLYFEDVPPKVSINEIIEIAKRYSTDQSSGFINGVLDSALEDLKSRGQIRKSGRGVVD